MLYDIKQNNSQDTDNTFLKTLLNCVDKHGTSECLPFIFNLFRATRAISAAAAAVPNGKANVATRGGVRPFLRGHSCVSYRPQNTVRDNV
jgi:hypothetical protein